MALSSNSLKCKGLNYIMVPNEIIVRQFDSIVSFGCCYFLFLRFPVGSVLAIISLHFSSVNDAASVPFGIL